MDVWFLREGKTGVQGEKPVGARTRTNNKPNPYMMLTQSNLGHIGGTIPALPNEGLKLA